VYEYELNPDSAGCRVLASHEQMKNDVFIGFLLRRALLKLFSYAQSKVANEKKSLSWKLVERQKEETCEKLVCGC
jgi:hypothetical protein